ncbi:DUF4625 domain-containing protein [Wenyingzhuangia sp. 1_MG-2023]|nr:DUF4625 domain-containing protein [Wenyingzhuangia sp. 1_MG-2023]
MKTITVKPNFKFLAMAALMAFSLQSCSEDDDSVANAPVISGFEYGIHGEEEHVAYKGSDLHLEAEINAEATVKSITVSIHAHDLEVGEGEEEWDFEQVFTDASYLVINPTFHEHIDIPANAPAGEYHVELVVTDELGNSTEVEGHIDILDPVTISDFDIDETVVRGNDIHVEFMIAAVNGIHNITVDIHAHGLTVGEGEEELDLELEFEEGYHEQTDVEFHEHIDIPATAPAGEYHVTFTVEDEDGNTAEYETHLDITE